MQRVRSRLFARRPAPGGASAPPAVWLTLLLAVAIWPTAVRPAARAAGTEQAGAPPHAVERVPFVRLDQETLYRGPAGEERRLREQRRQEAMARRAAELHDALGPHRVSRRSLSRLSARGLGPARAAAGLTAAAAAAGEPDTLRVLLVRIGFASDRSGDLTSVTTDGDFQLAPDSSIRVDPPPHDRAFFESHLYGLSQFYTFQSGGRLVIDGRVLPAGDTDCFRLSDIADYGPGADQSWSYEGLERLVRDMIAAADTGLLADGIDLSDYGDDNPFAYVIFVHAGSDWQSDVAGDSPNDIPTFFVALGEPAALQGGGALSECSIIPETSTQDGYLGSIAASLYHEFGHALGLVDIYDSRRGLPRVGVWTLMDSGTNLAANIGFLTPTPDNPDSVEIATVVGLLPPSLGAWDKWFLGWLETASLGGQAAPWRLPAVQVPRADYPAFRDFGYDFRGPPSSPYDPQALVGGASTREFFLIENRWVPFFGDELPASGGDPANIFLVRDGETGVILYLGGDPDGDGPQPQVNTGMYDYFLPDGGLLVWHVNQQRIESSLLDNTINTDGDGLRLVEADGIQDIGVLAPYVLGFYGSPRDPFHAAKPGSPATSTELRIEGAPATRTFDRSWSGVWLADISANEAVMTLTGGVEPLVAGAPLGLPSYGDAEAFALAGTPGPRALAPLSLTPCTLLGAPALVCADAPRADWADTTFAGYGATLFAWRQEGSAVALPPADLPSGAFHRFGAPLAGPPLVLAGAAGDAGDVVIAAAANGVVTAFRADLGDGSLGADWSRRVGARLAFAPTAVGDSLLLCCVPPDTLQLLRVDGTDAGRVALGSPVGGFLAPARAATTPDGEAACVVFSDAGWLPAGLDFAPGRAPSGAGAVPYGFVPGPGELPTALLPDDARGPLVIVAAPGGDLRAWRLLADGGHEDAEWGASLDGAAAGEPAVADLDGDGRHDLIALSGRRIHAFNVDGVPLRGFPVPLRELFPLADTTRIAAPLAVCDADGDGRNELFLATEQGHLIGLDATGRLLARTPLLWGGASACGLAVGPSATEGGRVLWLGDGGGRVAPPLDRRWLNGRVIGYALPASGTATVVSSEWFGPAGGPARTGPTGPARDLGTISPLRAEENRIILYPNPTREARVTVRFYSATGEPARASLHNLEGEVVAEAVMPATAGLLNEFDWSLPRLASGVYLVRVEATGTEGRRRWVTRLAVER